MSASTPPKPQGAPEVTPAEELPAGFRQHPAEAALKVIGGLDKAFVQMGASIATEISNAVAAVLQEVRASRPLCALCAIARADWDDANADTIGEAQVHYAQAAATLQEGEQLPELVMFLPEAIRPDPSDPLGKDGHMPMVFPATVYLGGAGFCTWHIADEAAARRSTANATVADQVAKQKKPILLAGPGISLHEAAALASRPVVPGPPGRQ